MIGCLASEDEMADIQIVITGLLYVFGVLALIIALLTALSLIMRRIGNDTPGKNEKNGKSGKKKALRADEAGNTRKKDGIDTAETRMERADEAEEEDAALAAVIAAAIAQYESAKGNKSRFRILSFRRAGDN